MAVLTNSVFLELSVAEEVTTTMPSRGRTTSYASIVFMTSIVWLAMHIVFLMFYVMFKDPSKHKFVELHMGSLSQKGIREYVLQGKMERRMQKKMDALMEEEEKYHRRVMNQTKASNFSRTFQSSNALDLHSENVVLKKDIRRISRRTRGLEFAQRTLLNDLTTALGKQPDGETPTTKTSSSKSHYTSTSKTTSTVNQENTSGRKLDGSTVKDKDLESPQDADTVPMHVVRSLDVTTMPRDPVAPGENGEGIIDDDIEKVEEAFKIASFNQHVSDQISIERSLPDVRAEGCNTSLVGDDLPSTSVVICFCEESWSTLLRTVHSVLNRSPPQLIKEIILVDDASSRDHLKKKLDDYMKRFPKVKIIHLPERAGLIRARLRGAALATGDVLTFLDSHVECGVGWLEPLLDRIRLNRRAVVCPSIDVIEMRTFRYSSSGHMTRGGFDWRMHFRWNTVPDYEVARRKTEKAPIRSPTMAGGLFSIHKMFFEELGQYDPGLEIWGGENLELSFKTWMCGGTLEILPCSRVGHIFRQSQPYRFPGGGLQTVQRNSLRVVQVWMDEIHRKAFYAVNPELKDMNISYGDVSARRQLRERLGCKSFQWYLDTVYKEMRVPDLTFQASGESFLYNWENHLRHEELCLVPYFPPPEEKRPAELHIDWCEGQDEKLIWKHTRKGQIIHVQTSLCLDVPRDKRRPILTDCTRKSRTQKWKFLKYFDKDGNEILENPR
ncbi:PREDICTED: polypeptide N-acetylgalactosaminyltransferase 13-like [Branchiostoma belcheri]|uniref:Polypeptide N-acetylgalactosaminyltransferase n=1 Tax=Branchiostoma belcheri TaxID=7741 RepID=A0A6P4ZE81_BRABE|nr:PREDICTED: polypeptide N-acetylgalactosaminyltransferase 13-like [Branchiostoma belcheri]